MEVKLLKLTENALEFIGDCAGICYGSPRNPEANKRRAVGCKDKGHLATLRFAHAVFHISGISRVTSHQMVRSKHLDFLQRSQRYCKETEPTFYIPDHYPPEMQGTFEYAYRVAHDLYMGLLSKGIKKEDARFVLPEATHTELIVVGNLQAWLDFITLRTDPAAQSEIRTVATTIKELLHEQLPELF